MRPTTHLSKYLTSLSAKQLQRHGYMFVVIFLKVQSFERNLFTDYDWDSFVARLIEKRMDKMCFEIMLFGSRDVLCTFCRFSLLVYILINTA